jgi:hypothetical protein
MTFRLWTVTCLVVARMDALRATPGLAAARSFAVPDALNVTTGHGGTRRAAPRSAVSP